MRAPGFQWRNSPRWVARITPIISAPNTVRILRAGPLNPDGDDTVPRHRNATANDLAIAIAGLLALLDAGKITPAQYLRAYSEAWGGAVGDTLTDAAEATGADVRQLASEVAQHVSTLTAQASASSSALATSVANAGVKVSEAQRAARAVGIAGGVWALGHIATGAGHRVANPTSTVAGTWIAVGDDRTSDDCQELDGQSWSWDEVPQFPGDGQTDCGGMCRCEMDWVIDPTMESIGGYEDDVEEVG